MRVFLLLLWLCCLTGAAWAQSSLARVGFVDMARLLDEAPQMLAWRKRLEGEFATLSGRISAEAARLQELRKRRTQEDGISPESVLAELENEISTGERGLRRSREELSNLQSVRKNEALDAISQEIGEAAAEVARSEGFSAVMARDAAIFVDPALDLTERVLAKLREESP